MLRSDNELKKYLLFVGEWERVEILFSYFDPFKSTILFLSSKEFILISNDSLVYMDLFEHIKNFKEKKISWLDEAIPKLS
ncbi:hypothetical protein A3Q56_06312 [Intoshia linei]|uniref:Uncharacterized protein n=1 Tax=Intoshia linei TaxID=1819745 RepID=A0A177AVC3_9BILA|nr:hypothetical protein A3Q56_06312 [Intoshia linei]